MRISDWSSDVCSSDLRGGAGVLHQPVRLAVPGDEHLAVGGGDDGDAEAHLDLRRHADVDAAMAVVAERPAAMVAPAGAGIVVDVVLHGAARAPEIGRASCRERVCQYVYISVCAGSLKKKKKNNKT